MTTTRVPCLKCKVSIHPDTAQRNGGLCMPCSGSLSPRTAARREAFVAAFATAEASVRQQRAAEEATLEIADWIGHTGLDEAAERELPRYLRREWGEMLGEPGALTASDLQYLGRFATRRALAHFWRVPARSAGGKPSFAYVEIDGQGRPMQYGWSDRAPPRSKRQE